MLRLLPLITLIAVFAGCSTLAPRKLWNREKPKPSQNNVSHSPISQLGTALPAMKPGDERELNLIAAGEMAKNGYWKEAAQLYQEAEVMAPSQPRLDQQLAPVLAELGEYAESIERYRRQLENKPSNTELINNLAWTMLKADDVSGAETQFRRAIELEPQNQRFAVNLGIVLARQGRYDESLTVQSICIGQANAHHNIGVIAIEMGDEAAARKHFTLATSLANGPKSSHDFLAAIETTSIMK